MGAVLYDVWWFDMTATGFKRYIENTPKDELDAAIKESNDMESKWDDEHEPEPTKKEPFRSGETGDHPLSWHRFVGPDGEPTPKFQAFLDYNGRSKESYPPWYKFPEGFKCEERALECRIVPTGKCAIVDEPISEERQAMCDAMKPYADEIGLEAHGVKPAHSLAAIVGRLTSGTSSDTPPAALNEATRLLAMGVLTYTRHETDTHKYKGKYNCWWRESDIPVWKAYWKMYEMHVWSKPEKEKVKPQKVKRVPAGQTTLSMEVPST